MVDQKNKVKDLMDFVFPQQQEIPLRPDEGNEIPQMEGLIPQEAPVVQQPIEDYDAMLEADAIEKSLTPAPSINVSANTSNKTGGSTPPIPPSAPPEEDYRTKFLKQLEEARLQNQSNIDAGRETDNKVSLLNNMNKAFSQMGTGIANQAGYTKLTANPLEVASNKAGEAGMDNKSKLEGLAQAYGVNKDGENAALEKEKMRLAAIDRADEKSYKNKLLNYQMTKDKSDEKEADGAGQKKLDQEFAKDYNDYTSKDKANYESTLKSLAQIKKELIEEGDGVFSAGGGQTSVLPNALRRMKSKKWRDEAVLATNPTMKEMFPGAISDSERESAAKGVYNDLLPNSENAKLITQFEDRLKATMKNKQQKADYFQKNKGSLRGYEASNDAPSSSSSYPKTLRLNGQTAIVSNPQDEKEAKEEGWQ